jgi:uncharacterized protein
MLNELLSNQILWTAIIGATAAQVLKVLLLLIFNRSWEPERFLETGGMPSSHTAMVLALSVSVGIQYGFGGPYFAIAAIFSAIVTYDATGIRRAAGYHAQLLNDLVEELQNVFRDGFNPKPLKELLGHTYTEVAAGAVLGVLTALLSYALIPPR